jgi:hypothetical protein
MKVRKMKPRNHIVVASLKFKKRAGPMRDKKKLEKLGYSKHKKEFE